MYSGSERLISTTRNNVVKENEYRTSLQYNTNGPLYMAHNNANTCSQCPLSNNQQKEIDSIDHQIGLMTVHRPTR